MPVIEIPTNLNPLEYDLELYQKGTDPYNPNGTYVMSKKRAIPPKRKDETRLMVEMLEGDNNFINHEWYIAVDSNDNTQEFWGYALPSVIASNDPVLMLGETIWVLDPPPINFYVKPPSAYQPVTNPLVY